MRELGGKRDLIWLTRSAFSCPAPLRVKPERSQQPPEQARSALNGGCHQARLPKPAVVISSAWRRSSRKIRSISPPSTDPAP